MYKPFVGVAAVVLAAGAMFVPWGAPRPAAAEPTAAGPTIRFEYDCAVVPWPCDGPRMVRRWQAWTVACPASGCVWKWMRRAATDTEIEIAGGGYYRLYFGLDNDYDTIADFFREDSPSATEIYLDLVYQCTRYPYLCGSETGAWQLYACRQQRDGSCAWDWQHELTGNAVGVYEVLPYESYLLYWGLPRGRPATPTPAPTATPTRTPTATRTATATRTPSATPTDAPPASATPFATTPPTQTVTSPTPDAEPSPIFLPRGVRP